MSARMRESDAAAARPGHRKADPLRFTEGGGKTYLLRLIEGGRMTDARVSILIHHGCVWMCECVMVLVAVAMF
jgi:hypothetical protein